MRQRPSWDEYFMEMAELARKRSTCLRRGVGAVIVKDNRVIATGYNGVPKGIRHCEETGCLRQQLNVPSGKMHEGTLYCTTQPCVICTKMIINAGIKRVVIKESYPDALAQEMAAEAGLVIDVMEGAHE